MECRGASWEQRGSGGREQVNAAAEQQSRERQGSYEGAWGGVIKSRTGKGGGT